MSLQPKLKFYLNLFYRLGFSPPIQLHKPNKSKWESSATIRNYSPILLFMFNLTTDILWAWTINTPDSQYYSSIEKIIGNLFAACDIIKIISIFVPAQFCGRIFAQILSNTQNIQSNLARSLQWHIDYDIFKRSFRKAAFSVLVTYLLSVLVYMLDTWLVTGLEYQRLLLKIWQLVSLLAFVYVAFYVDLMRYHLLQLNLVIKHVDEQQNQLIDDNISSHKKSVKDLMVQKKMQIYKIIYFRLWEISQKINNIFGWTIAALFLQTFADATSTSYWLYYSICEGKHIVRILRE